MRRVTQLVSLLTMLGLLASAIGNSSDTREAEWAPAPVLPEGATISVTSYNTMGLEPLLDRLRCGEDPDTAMFEVLPDQEDPASERLSAQLARHRAFGDWVGSLLVNPASRALR